MVNDLKAEKASEEKLRSVLTRLMSLEERMIDKIDNLRVSFEDLKNDLQQIKQQIGRDD